MNGAISYRQPIVRVGLLPDENCDSTRAARFTQKKYYCMWPFGTRRGHVYANIVCGGPKRQRILLICMTISVWLRNCLKESVTKILQALGETIDHRFLIPPNQSPRLNPF